MANDKIGKKISKEEFDRMSKKYQDKNPGKVRFVRFTKDAVQEILTPDAEYINVYFGELEDGSNTIMLAAADKNKKLLSSDIMDRGQPCPPYCA